MTRTEDEIRAEIERLKDLYKDYAYGGNEHYCIITRCKIAALEWVLIPDKPNEASNDQ